MTRGAKLLILLVLVPVAAAAWWWSWNQLKNAPRDVQLLEAESLMAKYENLKRQGRITEANQVLARVLAMGEEFFREGERKKASQVFGMVLMHDEGNATARRYADLLRVANDAGALILEYDEQAGAGSDKAAAETMDKLLVEARRLYLARDFGGAKDVFNQILARRPDQPLALSFMGVMAKDDGDFEAAIDYYKRAIAADPNTPANYYNLAGIHFEQKNHAVAEELLQSAMRLGMKSSYHLLYALCGRERGVDEKDLIRRLHRTIDAAALQVYELKPGEMPPVENDWLLAARLLKERGDDYGVTRLRQLGEEAKKPEVKAFVDELTKKME